MAKFKLIEVPAPGSPPADQRVIRASLSTWSEGDQMFIVDQVLTDRHGSQRGAFVLRATVVRGFLATDALMAFQATNTITGKG
jgi:hypothetical protein